MMTSKNIENLILKEQIIVVLLKLSKLWINMSKSILNENLLKNNKKPDSLSVYRDRESDFFISLDTQFPLLYQVLHIRQKESFQEK